MIRKPSPVPSGPTEPPVGLTLWASGAPPWVGWWKTRLKSFPTTLQPQRRWWDGQAWSLLVVLGESDADADSCRRTKSPAAVGDVEWCGRTTPHPGGLPYTLAASPRTELAKQLQRAAARPAAQAIPQQIASRGRVKLLEN